MGAWVCLPVFLPRLHSLLPYSIPGSAWWKTPLCTCEWETLGVSLLLLIRTGHRFRSPVSPFIIISSHSLTKLNPIPPFTLQTVVANMQCRKRLAKIYFRKKLNHLLMTTTKLTVLIPSHRKSQWKWHFFFCSLFQKLSKQLFLTNVLWK